MKWQFRFEPTAWSEALRQIVILSVVMNWLPLTEPQQDGVLMDGDKVDDRLQVSP